MFCWLFCQKNVKTPFKFTIAIFSFSYFNVNAPSRFSLNVLKINTLNTLSLLWLSSCDYVNFLPFQYLAQ